MNQIVDIQPAQPKRRYFTAVQQSELRAFWFNGRPLKELADRWGCSVPYVSQKARDLRLPLRRYTQTHKNALANYNYLAAEAKRRDLTISRLKRRLLRIICEDKMVNAILDDEMPNV